MLKALVKKQLLELKAVFFRNRRSGSQRSGQARIGFGILLAVLALALGASFFAMCLSLLPLLSTPSPWLYYSLVCIIAVVFGVFGSVFNTYASLYHAKDNETLLAMPIPPRAILLARLIGVAASSFLYSSLILVPGVLVRVLMGSPSLSVGGIVCSLLLIPVVTLLVTCLTSLLGWVVALISSRLKNKNIVVSVLSFALMIAYLVFCSRSYEALEALVANSAATSGAIHSWAAPFYAMGCAGEGSLAMMALVLLGVLLLLVPTFLLMSRTFLSITTRRASVPAQAYQEKRVRSTGMGSALLRKELKKFFSTPSYLLNMGLGCVMSLIAGAALLVKGGEIRQTLSMLAEVFPQTELLVPVLVVSAVLTLLSTSPIAAPSVSLEAKNLWILQSLPIPARDVLKAKAGAQLVLTSVPTFFALVCMCFSLHVALLDAVIAALLTAALTLLFALFSLMLSLKFPNFTWTSDTAVIKQSMGVMIAMFGGWLLALVMAGAYFFLWQAVSPVVYMLAFLALALLFDALLIRWLRTRGTAIFSSL